MNLNPGFLDKTDFINKDTVQRLYERNLTALMK